MHLKSPVSGPSRALVRGILYRILLSWLMKRRAGFADRAEGLDRWYFIGREEDGLFSWENGT